MYSPNHPWLLGGRVCVAHIGNNMGTALCGMVQDPWWGGVIAAIPTWSCQASGQRGPDCALSRCNASPAHIPARSLGIICHHGRALGAAIRGGHTTLSYPMFL